HTSERLPSRLKPIPQLSRPPFPSRSPHGPPEALSCPILRRLSRTSQSRTAPCYAVLRDAPAGCCGALGARQAPRARGGRRRRRAAGVVAQKGLLFFLSIVARQSINRKDAKTTGSGSDGR